MSRVPGAAFWIGLCAVAAAGTAGFLHWEASMLDDAIRELDGTSVEGGTLRITETGRTWLSRGVEVVFDLGEPIVLRGTARVGWGATMRLSLDETRGLGRWISAVGIRNWQDEAELVFGPTGKPKSLSWTLQPFTLGDCAVKGMRLRRMGEHWSFESDGLACKAQHSSDEVRLANLRATGEFGKRMTLSTGAFAYAGMKGQSYRFEYVLEPVQKKKQTGLGVLDDVRTDRFSFEFTNLEDDEERWDRLGVKSRVLGATDELFEDFRVVMLSLVLGSDSLQTIFPAIEDAFVSKGLVWELDEAVLTQEGCTARMAGRLAYGGMSSPGAAPTLGVFTLSVPDKMIGEDFRSQITEDGTMRREGDFWISNLELTTEHLLANGIVIF